MEGCEALECLYRIPLAGRMPCTRVNPEVDGEQIRLFMVRIRIHALNHKEMDLKISKSNYMQLLSLIDKACNIIKSKEPPPREYNVARQLGNIKKHIIKQNKTH